MSIGDANPQPVPPQPANRGFAPKYIVVRDLLGEQIRSGKLKVGDRIPSQQQLVKTCGVSGNTCKRAIQTLVDDGILEGEQGRGVFVRSALGRSEVRQIALVAWSDEALSQHPAFAAGMQGLMRALAVSDYQLSVSFLAPSQLHAGAMQARLAQIHAAGIIITHSPRDVQQALEPLRHKGVPLLSIGRVMERLTPYAVLTDMQGGLARAVDAALARGIRRITFLGCPLDEIFERRLAALEACFDRAGRSRDDLIIRRGEATHKAGKRLMAEVLATGERPDLVIGDDDFVAYGAIDALKQASLKVPRDVQVLGIGGFLNASLSQPALTALSLPVAEAWAHAGRMMIDLVEGRTPPDPTPLLECPIHFSGTFDLAPVKGRARRGRAVPMRGE